jgi:hypothetical protein
MEQPFLGETEGPRSRRHDRPSDSSSLIIPALLLVVLAVIGNIIVVRIGTTGNLMSPANVATLSQIFSAALWVGSVWLGGLLAYLGIMQSRR